MASPDRLPALATMRSRARPGPDSASTMEKRSEALRISCVGMISESDLDGDLGPYYGPFMQKLGDLSSQYELEKAALEQRASQTIIDQRASARHYMNLVNEFYERLRGLVMEGLQSRRDAEKRFASRLLEITKAEHDHIISELRAEDKKKIAFAKKENERRLDNCRVAVKVDLAGMLLQQRSALDRIKNEEIQALHKGWENEKLQQSQKVKDLMEQIKTQERKITEERVERTCALRDLTEELETSKAEYEKLNSAHKRMRANERELREDYQALTIEFDALKDEMRATEEEFSSQITALKQIIFQKEQQVSSWEQKYFEKCEEFDQTQAQTAGKDEQLSSLTTQVSTLVAEKKQLEQDVSDLEHDFGVLSRMLDAEKAERHAESKQMQLSLHEQQEVIVEQRAELVRLREAVEGARDRLEAREGEAARLQEERDQAAAALRHLREEVTVWLLDEICLRFDKSVDFDFDGATPIEDSDAEHIRYTEHRDLYYLIRVLAMDGFVYRGSEARVEVSRMTFLAGLVDQARSTPRLESAPAPPSDEAGAAGGSSARVSVMEEKGGESESRAPSARSAGGPSTIGDVRSRASSARATGRSDLSAAQSAPQRPSTAGGPDGELEEARRKLLEVNSGCEDRIREWRAKCIALAQRLERAETDLGMPRPADVEKIRQLEGQVKALVWALKEATGGGKGAATTAVSGPLPYLRRSSKAT